MCDATEGVALVHRAASLDARCVSVRSRPEPGGRPPRSRYGGATVTQKCILECITCDLRGTRSLAYGLCVVLCIVLYCILYCDHCASFSQLVAGFTCVTSVFCMLYLYWYLFVFVFVFVFVFYPGARVNEIRHLAHRQVSTPSVRALCCCTCMPHCEMMSAYVCMAC